jgi:polysaccharide export outer membrane protein
MNRKKSGPVACFVSLVILVAAGLSGCSAQNSPGSASNSPYAANGGELDSRQQLQAVAEERENDSFATSFGIGPGDILEISVPDIDAQKRVERVSPQGTVELPIAGSIDVNGLSEAQLNAAVADAYSKYVKDPEVDVFVKSYSSRQVAVVGMVNKPGLYTLNRRNETILDLIGRAGGISENAGSSIVFVPASPNQNEAPMANQNEAPMANQNEAPMANAIGNSDNLEKPPSENGSATMSAMAVEPRMQVRAEQSDQRAASNWGESASTTPASWASQNQAIFINFTTSDQGELNVPVRPGDVIMIPARGQVLVQGWVPNPGAYQITPGMTALGAVTAAGGQLYSSSAVVLRAGPDGKKVQLPVNLSGVEKGRSADVEVISGDVVIVERSLLGALPYSLYFLLSKFGTGMYFPAY